MMGEIWMKNMGGREEKEWEMGDGREGGRGGGGKGSRPLKV